jgi:phosphoadenylyl-sulfate reductase (thioredoxin)
MADADPIQPIHEPTLPYVDEETAWVHRAAERFEDASAEDLLAWALERFHPKMAISAAGGVDGMVLVDMAWRINPEVRVFTLDTGRLPPETYALFEEVRERYGIGVEFEQPDGDAVSSLVTAHGPNLMYKAVDLRLRCCEIRKVEPLKRKLATLDAWVAGLRREQSPERADTPKLHWDDKHGLWKANPLADWSERDVWAYVFEHQIPYNELHDRDFESIGCKPCTAPGSGRAGRWAGTDKVECGLHAA